MDDATAKLAGWKNQPATAGDLAHLHTILADAAALLANRPLAARVLAKPGDREFLTQQLAAAQTALVGAKSALAWSLVTDWRFWHLTRAKFELSPTRERSDFALITMNNQPMKSLRLLLLAWLPIVSLEAADEIVGPWNLTALKGTVPAMKWLRQDQPVHSLTYAGEEFEGHSTEVFAFYASPRTLGEAPVGAKFPGVVLIHGGGGTAFAEWVHLWAKRGYAAIAVDLAARGRPTRFLKTARWSCSGRKQKSARACRAAGRPKAL